MSDEDTSDEKEYFFDGILQNGTELVANNIWIPQSSSELQLYVGDVMKV